MESLQRYGIESRLISHEVKQFLSVQMSVIYNCFKAQNLDEIKEDIGSDAPQIKLLYITPVNLFINATLISFNHFQERLQNREFKEFLQNYKDSIGFIAVDEVK